MGCQARIGWWWSVCKSTSPQWDGKMLKKAVSAQLRSSLAADLSSACLLAQVAAGQGPRSLSPDLAPPLPFSLFTPPVPWLPSLCPCPLPDSHFFSLPLSFSSIFHPYSPVSPISLFFPLPIPSSMNVNMGS